MHDKNPSIGERLFTDGVTRPVFLDLDHRQYIIGDDNERVDGVWIYREEDHPDLPTGSQTVEDRA